MKLFDYIQKKIFPQRQNNSGTVRYMYPVFFGFVVVLAAATILTTDSSYVELEPSTDLVIAGDVFSIDVYAYAHVPVNALDLTISFLPGSITVVGVDQGESVLTIWTEEPKITSNAITLSGGTYRRGFVGRHKIATINVEANQAGKTEFFISQAEMLAGDGSGSAVTVTKAISEKKQSFIIYDKDTDPSVISAAADLNINADIDGDGFVTLKDISAFMSAWYSGTKQYDFNNDLKMNFKDFSIILARSFFDRG